MEAPTQLIQFQKESDKGAKYSIEIKALNEYIKILINSNDTIPSSSYEKKKYIYPMLKIIDIFQYALIFKNYILLYNLN